MSRASLIALTVIASACSSGIDLPAEHLVLLQYAGTPTSADSLAASQIGAAPVTIYPIASMMVISTRVATSAFAGLNRNPTVTDGNNISPGCSAPSVFFATRNVVTASDSAAATLAGIRVAYYSHNMTHFAGDFERAMLNSVLDRVDGLSADANISAVQFDFSGPCPSVASAVGN